MIRPLNVQRMYSALTRIPIKHPFAFGAGFAALKTGGADYVTQRYVEGKEHVDKTRSAIFFTWGLCYLGGVQYFLYCKVFAQRLFPTAGAFAAKPLREKLLDRVGQVKVLKQVFLDQFLHHPFLFFPLFYQLKAYMEDSSPRDAVQTWRRNLLEDCCTLWSIWVPVQIVNMSFSPIWMRIPFVTVVSMFYTAVLSSMRGARQTFEELDIKVDIELPHPQLMVTAQTRA